MSVITPLVSPLVRITDDAASDAVAADAPRDWFGLVPTLAMQNPAIELDHSAGAPGHTLCHARPEGKPHGAGRRNRQGLRPGHPGGKSSRSGSVVQGIRLPTSSSPAAQPAISPAVSAIARTRG